MIGKSCLLRKHHACGLHLSEKKPGLLAELRPQCASMSALPRRGKARNAEGLRAQHTDTSIMSFQKKGPEMKKILAIVTGCLVVFALIQSTPALAGAGCAAKCDKTAKAACGEAPKACGDGAKAAHGAMSCNVDGKTVTCTMNADGTCSFPAGTVDPASAKDGMKTCTVDGKTVTCKVNADGSCTMKGSEACHGAAAKGSCSMPCAPGAASGCSGKAAKAEAKDPFKSNGL